MTPFSIALVDFDLGKVGHMIVLRAALCPHYAKGNACAKGLGFHR
jgi:hypothetical protein